MKTQLIQLDKYDDVVSARDKILWSKAPRILLVFPRSKSLNFALMDLLLLFRQAQQQGAQIAFVVSAKETRRALDRIGIPVFVSVNESNRKRWRTGYKIPRDDTLESDKRTENQAVIFARKDAKNQSQPLPLVLRLPVFLMAIAAVAMLAGLFLPAAKIMINTDARSQVYRIELQGDPAVQNMQLSGVIPVNAASVVVTHSRESSSTGEVLLPGSKAKGELLVTNLTTGSVQMPSGTVFSTLDAEPARFISTKSSLISAGVGETALVPVEAVLPGSDGNVGAEKVRAVEGSLGLSLSVTNPDAISRGAQVKVNAPSEADYTLARTALLQDLGSLALQELSRDLASGQIIIEDSVSKVRIIEEKRSPEVGQPGQFFDVWMEAEYQAWYIQESDVTDMAKALLDATLPVGFRPVSDAIEIAYLDDPEILEGRFRWPVSVRRQIEREFVIEDFIRLVAGKKPENAVHLLLVQYELERAPEIRMDPVWWPFMPFLGSQYEVSKVQ